jgi:drug/metabolite transporter (DMT)-like permease
VTGFLDRFFRTSAPSLQDVESTLWAATPAEWEALPASYSAALLEQYKLYVEMADRVSARRSLTNTFFLTLNAAVFTLFGVFWQYRPQAGAGWLVFPVIGLVGQCGSWYWLLRSYRQLNAAKYAVIGALETRLPTSMYWKAEWTALGEGRDPQRYLPLTHLEQWIPLLFGAVYVIAFFTALLS